MSELLAPTLDRFSLFPIRHDALWTLYKQQQQSLWNAEEIDLESDMADWKSLTANEQRFVKMVLAFFANADGIVNENVVTRLYNEVQLPEARAFYSVQIFVETIHAETYGLLIDRFCSGEEKDALFHAVERVPCVRRKAAWALRWLESDRPFGERLFAFAIVEGLFFSASFCAIFWLKKRSLMPGLGLSNELISKDEGLHFTFAVAVFGMLEAAERPSAETMGRILTEAVACEDEFVRDALAVDLIGMNSSSMVQYVHFVADFVARSFGIDEPFGAPNPYPWMDLISLSGKANFFEKRVSDYRRNISRGEFALDGDF